jgi:hypothetical protein
MRFNAILFALAAAAVALGAPPDSPQVRPARGSELVGLWQMVDVTRGPSADAEDSQLAPFQIFYFDRRGWMKFMTSMKPFSKGQLALFDSAPLVTRYEMEKDGTLALTNPAWDEPRRYHCNAVTKVEGEGDVRAPHVGDLVLAATDAEGKPVWAKLLRKVPE